MPTQLGVGGLGDDTPTANTNRFSTPVSSIWGTFPATETERQYRMRVAGTFSKLWLRVNASSGSASNSTYKFRKNGADGNQLVTCTGNTTGSYEDASNTDSASAGDDVATVFLSPAGSTLGLGEAVCLFTPSSGQAVTLMDAWYTTTVSITTASVSRYVPVQGRLSSFETTVANVELQVDTAGDMKYLQLYVSANARTSTSVTSMIDGSGVSAQMSVTIGASTTGLFEDTTHTDSLVANNRYAVRFITGTGSATLTLARVGIAWATATESQVFPGLASNGIAYASATTAYGKLPGLAGFAVTESNHQSALRQGMTFSTLGCYLSANSRPAMTLSIRKNGATGNLAVSITASTTGYFEDAAHTDVFASGDLINTMLSPGTGTNSATFRAVIATGALTPTAINDSDTAAGTEGTPSVALSSTDAAGAGTEGTPKIGVANAETQSAVEGTPTTAFGNTDTSSSADAVSKIGVSTIEAGTGTEGSPAVGTPAADTATAAENAPTVGTNSTDTSTAADAVSTIGVAPATDTGTGVENEALAAALSNADVGTGVENAPTIGTSSADSSSSSDNGTVAAQLAGDDTATGDDQVGRVGLTNPDTGTTVEAIAGIALAHADSSTGADDGSLAAATSGSDTSSGDEGTPSVGLTAADSSSATDDQELAIGVVDDDTATGQETALSVALSHADAGTAAEQQDVAVGVAGAESGAAADDVLLIALSNPEAATGGDASAIVASQTTADAGTGADAQLLTALVGGADEEQAIEDAALAAFLTGTDDGTGLDAGVVVPHFTVTEAGTSIAGTIPASSSIAGHVGTRALVGTHAGPAPPMVGDISYEHADAGDRAGAASTVGDREV